MPRICANKNVNNCQNIVDEIGTIHCKQCLSDKRNSHQKIKEQSVQELMEISNEKSKQIKILISELEKARAEADVSKQDNEKILKLEQKNQEIHKNYENKNDQYEKIHTKVKELEMKNSHLNVENIRVTSTNKELMNEIELLRKNKEDLLLIIESLKQKNENTSMDTKEYVKYIEMQNDQFSKSNTSLRLEIEKLVEEKSKFETTYDQIKLDKDSQHILITRLEEKIKDMEEHIQSISKENASLHKMLNK